MGLIDRLKTDPEFKTKFLRAAIFFGLFVIGIVVFALTRGGDENKVESQQNTVAGGKDWIPGDSTGIGMQKNEIYQSAVTDSINSGAGSGGAVLGGSITENQQSAEDGDKRLDNYMAARQQSIDRMQNSGTSYSSSSESTTYSTPVKRRSYNPNGSSSSWSSVSTSVVGESEVTSGSSSSQYRRSYTPEGGAVASTQSAPVQETKPLTKEQRLQQAIASKYQNGSQQGNGSVVAEIYNNQKVDGKNTSVRLVLKDKIYLKNGTIGTDAFVNGTASISNDNVTITVPSISYKGKNYNVNLVAYDYRTGELGIPVKTENLVGELGNRVKDEISGRIGMGGQIGGIISGIFSNRNKGISIRLNDGHRLYLKSQ